MLKFQKFNEKIIYSIEITLSILKIKKAPSLQIIDSPELLVNEVRHQQDKKITLNEHFAYL